MQECACFREFMQSRIYQSREWTVPHSAKITLGPRALWSAPETCRARDLQRAERVRDSVFQSALERSGVLVTSRFVAHKCSGPSGANELFADATITVIHHQVHHHHKMNQIKSVESGSACWNYSYYFN